MFGPVQRDCSLGKSTFIKLSVVDIFDSDESRSSVVRGNSQRNMEIGVVN